MRQSSLRFKKLFDFTAYYTFFAMVVNLTLLYDYTSLSLLLFATQLILCYSLVLLHKSWRLHEK